MFQHLTGALIKIKKLHQLNHERIIRYFGFHLDQDQIIIFMEHLTGSVRDEINEMEHLTEIRALHYFTQAVEGLEYLHSRRPKAIVHGEIKCTFILFKII